MPIWQALYKANPLESVEPTRDDLSGWNHTSPVFRRVIERVKPSLIIEVGAWKGASAVHMARLCDADILCIDTWLGSSEMWEFPDLHRVHGLPTVYETFVSNVVRHVGRERICPMPLTSTAAAHVLAAKGIVADLIYVDGSHDYEDVSRDLQLYWPLVRPGGILFGDDAQIPGVARALYEQLPHAEIHMEKFVATKP